MGRHSFNKRNYKNLFVLFLILAGIFSAGFFLDGPIHQPVRVSVGLDKFLKEILYRAPMAGLALAETSPTQEERQALERELKQLEEQIAQYDKNINKTEQEKKTLQNKISLLKNQINKLDLQIAQSNIVIKDITYQVSDTETSINNTSLKIESSKEKLANLLRLINQEDQKSLMEVLLFEGSVSNFFDNLMALEEISEKNRELLQNIKNLKSSLENQKESLDSEKEDWEKQVVIQTLQKKENARLKQEQESVLKLTEAEYQKQLQEKAGIEKRAQEIRARIFEMIGIPKAPTFGEAYEIAKIVSGQTGIRPALLLAVLTQESNIGKNVGQCYLANAQTGEGIRVQTGAKESRVMCPSQSACRREPDVPHFLEITQGLARDPYKTPISCVMKDKNGNPFGWGGAMGPSQFIPSTWILYQDKFSQMAGRRADPWNIGDAFLATAIYLKDLGAGNNEFRAVMRYFSGNTWSKWEEFYGNAVLSIARQYEEDIKAIESAK